MKRFRWHGIFALATIFLLGACASSGDLGTDTTSQTTTTVPGEKLPGEGVGAAAGPTGPAANVRW